MSACSASLPASPGVSLDQVVFPWLGGVEPASTFACARPTCARTCFPGELVSRSARANAIAPRSPAQHSIVWNCHVIFRRLARLPGRCKGHSRWNGVRSRADMTRTRTTASQGVRRGGQGMRMGFDGRVRIQVLSLWGRAGWSASKGREQGRNV